MTQSSRAGARPTETRHPTGGRRPLVRLAAVCFTVLLAWPAAAQDTAAEAEEDYLSLWTRGAYREALSVLSGAAESAAGWTRRSMQRDMVELQFITGDVDGAIATARLLVETYNDLSDVARLAELYRYRGLSTEFSEALLLGEELIQRLMRYGMNQEDFLAALKMASLRGDDPKEILGTRYKLLIDQRPMYTEAYVAAGALALRHRGYDVAAGHFRKALELDGENQAALAGLLECHWRVPEDPERAEALKAELLALNPHHFTPKAIEAERLLDSGQAGEALETIETVLAINPNELDFLAKKAAAHYLRDELGAMKAVQDAMLAFNPSASIAFRETGRVAARHYRFADAAAFQQRAVEIDPQDHVARAELAFNILRLGETDEGRPILEAAFAADPFNVQAYNMLNVLDSLAEFRTIERGPFVIRLPGYEAELLADDMLDLLDEEIALYEAKYEVTLARPIYLEVFEDHDEFMVRSVGLPGNAGHLGICFGHLITMDSPRARPPGSTNWHSVLWHEFVHVVTLQKTKNRMPRWLSEGISVYEETARNAAWGTPMSMEFKPIYQATPRPGLSDLESYFTAPGSMQHLMYGYFSAGEFIAYYVEAYGHPALVAALAAIGEGARADEALRNAAGVDEGALTEGFAAHLAARCAPFGNLAEPPDPELEIAGPPMMTTPWISQPSPYVDTLKAAMDAWEAEDYATAAAKLEETYALYPDDKSRNAPLRLLARLYGDAEDTEKRIATLERIVAWDPTAYAECMALAEHYAEAAAWDEVLRVTAIAHGISPFDIGLLRTQADAYQAAGRPLEAAERFARLALADAVREGDYRMARARALQAGGETAEARRETVALLEKMPRYWDAQQLLLELAAPPEPAVIPVIEETAPVEPAEPEEAADAPPAI